MIEESNIVMVILMLVIFEKFRDITLQDLKIIIEGEVYNVFNRTKR